MISLESREWDLNIVVLCRTALTVEGPLHCHIHLDQHVNVWGFNRDCTESYVNLDIIVKSL